MNTYRLKVGNIERNLPIIAINDEISIASFVILGDTELIVAAAAQLVKKIPPVDFLVTAEAKGIPLVFELSRLLDMKKFFVVRKSIKPYMQTPIVDEVISITTQKKQLLCLDSQDAKELKNKSIAIVDDVISTGESIRALERIVQSAGGIVKARVAILAEGEAANREDLIFLEKLPIFKKHK